MLTVFIRNFVGGSTYTFELDPASDLQSLLSALEKQCAESGVSCKVHDYLRKWRLINGSTREVFEGWDFSESMSELGVVNEMELLIIPITLVSNLTWQQALDPNLKY